MIETVREAIEQLGGTAKVAKRYGVKPSAVSNWRVWDRFPARLHYRISRDAAELGIELSPMLFDAPTAATGQPGGEAA